MSKKRISYIDLLKEAALGNDNSENNTGKHADVKGPFLDPILGWGGDGELTTHKDASSILERYYFKEGHDGGVEVEEQEIPTTDDDRKPMPEDPTKKGVETLKKDIEDGVAKPDGDGVVQKEGDVEEASYDYAKRYVDKFQKEQEDAGDDDDAEDEDEDEDAGEEVEESKKEEVTESDAIEEAVIQKLIAEMEQDLDEMDFTKDANQTEPAGDPEKDANSEVPDRKDDVDVKKESEATAESDMVEALLGEQDEEKEDEKEEEKAEEEAPKEEEPLDVDKKMKNEMGPLGNPADAETQELEEAFKIFQEEIEEDDEKPVAMDSDEVRV